MNGFVTKYFLAATAYTVLHKTRIMKNANVQTYNYEKRDFEYRKLLISEKVLLLGISSCTAFIWPFYLMKDIYEAEVHMRGLDKDVYQSSQTDKKRSFYDFILD